MTNKDDLRKSLQPLVENEIITSSQRDSVVDQLAKLPTVSPSKGIKGLISEALVYLGGAIIFGSGALIINQTWDQLGRWGRPGVLVGAAALLWVAGLVILRKKTDDEGRRLTSTLLIGGAVLVGVAAQNLLSDIWIPLNAQGIQDWSQVALWVDPAMIVVSMSLAAILGAIAYRIAASALALSVTGGAALGVSMATGQLINYLVGPNTPRDQQFNAPFPWLAPALTVLGSLIWLLLWKREIFHEMVIAHILGLVGLFIGINSLRENYDEDAVSIVLIVAGLVGILLYVQSHQWPYLVFGLGGILLGGIQLLFKYVEGLGGALASMALGAVLVGVGIWLVKERVHIKPS